MSRLCPKCGYGDSSRERSMDGRTTCNACGYTVSNIQWDKEQSEAELNAGVSSRLRGNPLEIEKRYFVMQDEIKEMDDQLKGMAIEHMHLSFKIIELEDHIDNLEWVINDNTEDMNCMRMDYGDLKRENEKLELELEDIKRSRG